MESVTILQFAAKPSFKAVDDMAFLTPVVRKIPWGVSYDADAQPGELVGLPGCLSSDSRMRGYGYLIPVDDMEGDGFFIHRLITFFQRFFSANGIYFFIGEDG